MNNQKLPFYFTIDFEDFYFDSLRELGKNNPPSKEDSLYCSYYKIMEIRKKFLKNVSITFFVTGILAKKFPDLVKKIYQDDNEVACHYYFHDKINRSERSVFANNLDKAIEYIYLAIGEKPVGFRAPFFAIDPENNWAYEEISKRFLYDSSYRTSQSKEQLRGNYILNLNEGKFREHFIFSKSLYNDMFKIRTGGTFLRLFPYQMILNCMKTSYKSGHVPIVYLHPYDFDIKKNFWVGWDDLNFLKINKRVGWWLRQNQWSNLGHKTVDKKIEKISSVFEHQGKLKNYI